MIYLSDNRPHVYQWDTDIELTVAEGCTHVHFANSLYGRTTDVEVVDGKVFIPDKFLQSSRDIFLIQRKLLALKNLAEFTQKQKN